MECQNFWSHMLDNINEGIYILNRDGDYIYCNSAFLRMIHADRDEVLKFNAFRLEPEGFVLRSVSTEVFKQKRRLCILNNVVTNSGYHYRQLATATPLFDSMGEIEYVLVEMIRMDLLKKRYQEAFLNEDLCCIPVPEFGAQLENSAVLIAESPAMLQVMALARQMAAVDTAVLITGETGTGKEVLVNYIHKNGPRSRKPLVAINCSALPESLLEAELFGYESGAFTGSLATGKEGLIEQANGGTLFLDEINSMPLALQSKLLRVLECHKIRRLGALQERFVDFRLLAATNIDLFECVSSSTFRADLYYRLSVIPLILPPLRDRREDIVPLTNLFLDQFCQKYGRTKVLSRNAFDQLEQYCWPGNVRELKNVIERLLLTTSIDTIEVRQIPENILNGTMSSAIHTDICSYGKWDSLYEDDSAEFSLNEYIESCEKKVLADALRRCGSTYKAAKLLKIDQSTVARKKQKYHL
ncbi:sigma-54 interaction domain-containing protein [Papillibacter cinnamivorans]|uniref:HTH-type transcriptional regulatory protein TyrR n=1 Tax=Papillibacter cinnamivorans DSM 12816 TaxID=1122930 RepID=A0A1W2B7T1_9FIRM|nr:sigma 54-interacting transcriptional regulator [Papillibacter cinnamivorans]SMC68752.1 Transcriptional regulator containing PAS, AAA-type ATPase, and DNA-binding Fis domains [Papillibacter cinnamivorans DSM 12816]